jgi:hypothetical protein
MDALQVHALAAANTAGGATFYDVAVRFPEARGRCVCIFYGGEREAPHFPDGQTLNSRLTADAIGVRAYWPVSEYASKRTRVLEGEIAAFVKSFRTRVEGDRQLGGEGTDLRMGLATVDQLLLAGAKYAVADLEILCEYNEFTTAP